EKPRARLVTRMRNRLILASFLLTGGVLWAAANQPAQQTGSSPDMMLLEQESKFEREKTEYLQQNILDKILGPGKAVVIVDVEMGLESRNMEMVMGKNKSDKKQNPDENGDQPPPPSRVLVPGVPMPKSAIQYQQDRGGE